MVRLHNSQRLAVATTIFTSSLCGSKSAISALHYSTDLSSNGVWWSPNCFLIVSTHCTGISNHSKIFKTYMMTRKLIVMWERFSTSALITFSNFWPKTLKASHLQNYIIFAIISLSKMLRPTDLNSWVGNWEHLTSMEKVFTNSMKDNMSHQLPSTAAQSIRGNLISSEIIWAIWKHQCLSNVNFIFDRIYIVFKG